VKLKNMREKEIENNMHEKKHEKYRFTLNL